MNSRLRRLFGYRQVRVVDRVEGWNVEPTLGGYSVGGKIAGEHFEWDRVRPWWKVWRRG